MKLGFAKKKLNDALDLVVHSSGNDQVRNESKYAREIKFDVTDRVQGLWRPEDGQKREVKTDLFISAMAGEDSEGPWMLLGIDLCEFNYIFVDAVKAPIIKTLGIKGERIVFMPSHCHNNAAFDMKKLEQIVESAAKAAWDSRVEVEMGVLHLDIDAGRFVINRRVHVEGIGTRTVMFNDGCIINDDHMDVTAQVKTWIKNLNVNPDDFIDPQKPVITHGDVDDSLEALFFRDAKTKSMVGTFTRFSAHAVIVSAKKVQGDISADYPGHLKARLEQELGTIVIFGQGQCGDLRPLNREYSHEFAKEYGCNLADLIIDNFNKVSWAGLTAVQFHASPVNLPLRRDLPENKDASEKQMAEIDEKYDQEKNPEKRRKLQNLFWFFYRWSDTQSILRPQWLKDKQIQVFLYGLKLNDTVILANHGEIFLDTRNMMIAPFKDKNPVTVSICNEDMSYLPTKEAFERGGYEPSVCLAEPGSTDMYIEGAHRLLEKLYTH
jgi:hypothetical protein